MARPRRATPAKRTASDTNGVGAMLIPPLIGALLGLAILVGMAVTLVGQAGGLAALSTALLGEHAAWYLSRASAFVAYVLLWWSMVLGLSITNRLARLWPGGPAAADLHEHASLLGLAFGLLHALVLLGDAYIGYTLPQILIPFASVSYEPVMDSVQVEITTDHAIVNTGIQMLDAARHLWERLAPATGLLEISLAAPQLAANAPGETPASSPQVVIVRNDHTGMVLFGAHVGHAVAGLADHDVLQLISDNIRAQRDDEARVRSYRVVMQVRPPLPESKQITQPALTLREATIVRQLSVGKTDREIASDVDVSLWAVRYHLKNIYAKLGVKRRGEAIRWAVREGCGQESSDSR